MRPDSARSNSVRHDSARQGRAPARRRRPGNPGSRPAGAARPPARPRQSELDLALTAALSAPAPAATTFRELGLPAPLVAALAGQGIDGPFAIQARALPDALAGRDVLGRAQTGSGKTLAFGLPMLARLAAAPGPRRERAPRGLVLVPTRELAKQVANVLEPLGRPLGVTVTTVYGGASMGVQIDRLRRGVDIVVATPGRLIDLLERRACTLSRIEITVLDEADHMADLGFFPAVTRILDETPAGGQRMLFSATLDRDVERLVSAYLSEPALHAVAPVTDVATAADHQVFVLPAADKFAVAAELAGRPDRSLFFVRTKHGAARLAKQLTKAGVPSAAIHGNLNQNQRHRALASFAEGHPRVLVATDVAARGLHIDDVGLVVHFDPPHDHKDYLHRSGRTARAGASGTVVALVDPAQVGDVARLHDAAGITPTSHRVAAGHEAVREVATAGTPVPPAPARVPAAGPAARSRGPAGASRKGRPAGSPGPARAGGSGRGEGRGQASARQRADGGEGRGTDRSHRGSGPAHADSGGGARASAPGRAEGRGQAPARQRADGGERRGDGEGRGGAGARAAAPGRRGAEAGPRGDAPGRRATAGDTRGSAGGTRQATAAPGWPAGGGQRPARPGRPRRPRPGFRQAS